MKIYKECLYSQSCLIYCLSVTNKFFFTTLLITFYAITFISLVFDQFFFMETILFNVLESTANLKRHSNLPCLIIFHKTFDLFTPTVK